jgi:hypothetical protein
MRIVIFVFLISINLVNYSQIIQPKSGVFTGLLNCELKNVKVQFQIKNDTVCGNFKVWNLHNNKFILVSEGYFDNRKHNYDELKYKNGEDYFLSEQKSRSNAGIFSSENKQLYSKTLNFIDSCKLVNYIYNNSFITYSVDYDTTGKITKQEYNSIKYFKGKYREIADSVVQYKKGVKYRIRYENILSGESLYIIDKEYYDYKKGKLFYAGYSLIDPKNDNTISTDYYFHKNGRIKGVYTRYGLMYLSRIKDFDKQGKPMPFSDEDFISN